MQWWVPVVHGERFTYGSVSRRWPLRTLPSPSSPVRCTFTRQPFLFYPHLLLRLLLRFRLTGSFPFALSLLQVAVSLAMTPFAVTVLLISLVPCHAFGTTPTKLTMGTESVIIQGKIVYTSSAPLHFVLPNFTDHDPHIMRAIDFLRAHICENFNASCALASQWSSEMKELASEIKSFTIAQLPVRRPTRTIPYLGTLVGRITNWCCGVITEEQTNFLQTNEHILQRAVSDLSDALSNDHSQFINITHNMEAFARTASTRLHSLHAAISREHSALQNLSETVGHLLLQVSLTNAHFHMASLRIQRVRSLLSYCTSRQLFQDAINATTLTSHLSQLSSFLKSQGSELAIPISSSHLYYTEKLTSCVIANNNLHITIQVPVRQIASSWEIIHIIPIAFKWSHHICQVLSNSLLVLKRDNATFILSGANKDRCLQRNLCFLPRSRSNFDIFTCVLTTLNNPSIDSLRANCPFHCQSSNTTQVSQLDTDTFTIATPHSSGIINCHNEQPKPIFFPPAGAIKIRLPCYCSLQASTEEIISSVYPCDLHLAQAVRLHFVLPLIWSTQRSLTLDSLQSASFHNISHIIDASWPTNITWGSGISPLPPLPHPVLLESPSGWSDASLFAASPLTLTILTVINSLGLAWLIFATVRLALTARPQ